MQIKSWLDTIGTKQTQVLLCWCDDMIVKLRLNVITLLYNILLVKQSSKERLAPHAWRHAGWMFDQVETSIKHFGRL